MQASSSLREGIRRSDWFVGDTSLASARRLVETHHYAKGGSNTCVFAHGLFHRLFGEGEPFGVAWWLPPTKVACQSVSADWTRVLGLTRMVLVPDMPRNACSFLLSRSIALIRQDGRFKHLVTYADESQGHTGGVYRASNWTYVGRTGPYPRWVDPSTGRQVSVKATTSRTAAQMQALGYEKTGSFHKHKFTLHL